nr:hypothetical protein [Tanacetum cinerariifolium]
MVVRWWFGGDDGSRLRWPWWLRWWREMAWRWLGDTDGEDDRGGGVGGVRRRGGRSGGGCRKRGGWRITSWMLGFGSKMN